MSHMTFGRMRARWRLSPGSAYLPFDLVIHADAPPRDVLQMVIACGRLLSRAGSQRDPGAHVRHHAGPRRSAGFPPEPLCAAVLARLFPDAPEGDPVQVLLWSTGRAELDDRPRVTSWIPKAVVD